MLTVINYHLINAMKIQFFETIFSIFVLGAREFCETHREERKGDERGCLRVVGEVRLSRGGVYNDSTFKNERLAF